MTKQEARAYKEEREVVAVRRLIEAFQTNDVAAFERILQVRWWKMWGIQGGFNNNRPPNHPTN